MINKLLFIVLVDTVDDILKMFDSKLAEEPLRDLIQLNVLTELDGLYVVVDAPITRAQTVISCRSKYLLINILHQKMVFRLDITALFPNALVH